MAAATTPITARAGSDTVDYSAATSTVTVNLNTVTAQNTGTFGGTDTITNIENVVGAAAFANTLTGNTAGQPAHRRRARRTSSKAATAPT